MTLRAEARQCRHLGGRAMEVLRQCSKRAYGLSTASYGASNMRVRLTPTFCASAKAPPGSRSIIYWDEQMPGFGLRVHQSGARSWVVQYRSKRVVRRMT